MNKRIKKKLKKKVTMSMMQFDPYLHKMVPVSKTYRGIKNERKKVHESVIWLRQLYTRRCDDRLKDKRRCRRDYRKAFDEKLKRHVSSRDRS